MPGIPARLTGRSVVESGMCGNLVVVRLRIAPNLDQCRAVRNKQLSRYSCVTFPPDILRPTTMAADVFMFAGLFDTFVPAPRIAVVHVSLT